jgi:hypothetical protein
MPVSNALKIINANACFFKVADNVSAMCGAGLRGTHYQTTQSLRARQDARI